MRRRGRQIPPVRFTQGSYIDDLRFTVISNSISRNLEVLARVRSLLWEWGAGNGVAFDAEKEELMHHHARGTKGVKDPLITDSRCIAPEVTMRWLGVWLDRASTFSHHYTVKTAAGASAWNLVKRLSKINGGGLGIAQTRLVINSCIMPIMDYGSAVTYNGDLAQVRQLQVMQNQFLRRVLGVVKQTPIAVLAAEAQCPPCQVRLEDAMEREAVHWRTLPSDHPIITSMNESSAIETRLHRIANRILPLAAEEVEKLVHNHSAP